MTLPHAKPDAISAMNEFKQIGKDIAFAAAYGIVGLATVFAIYSALF